MSFLNDTMAGNDNDNLACNNNDNLAHNVACINVLGLGQHSVSTLEATELSGWEGWQPFACSSQFEFKPHNRIFVTVSITNVRGERSPSPDTGRKQPMHENVHDGICCHVHLIFQSQCAHDDVDANRGTNYPNEHPHDDTDDHSDDCDSEMD